MLERREGDTGIVFYVSPLLERAGVPHAFTTRIGGVSQGPFNSLNMGNPAGPGPQDPRDRIRENYRRLQCTIGAADRNRCWVHQVHGRDVVFVRHNHEFANGAKADALVCNDPERMLVVRVADCVPILLADGAGRAVAAVHAGWRGVIGGVVPNAVRELRRFANGTTLAAIGPCIGRCAFEVGGEVLEEFRNSFGADAPIDQNGNGKGWVDLRRAVQMQLIAAGLTPDCIDTTDRCTFRDADEFFSHRRERGITGRMAAVISPRRTNSIAA